jgi:hypothetical protein
MTSVLLTTVSFADAQQQKKAARVGYLWNSASVEANSMKPFRERLRELGYTEGQNITIEHRSWEGKVERLPELKADLAAAVHQSDKEPTRDVRFVITGYHRRAVVLLPSARRIKLNSPSNQSGRFHCSVTQLPRSPDRLNQK